MNLFAPTPAKALSRPDLIIILRLLSKVKRYKDIVYKGTMCWCWTGAANRSSKKSGPRRGHMKVDGKTQYVHRISYATFNGPVKEEMTVQHDCRNTICCNPEHLSLMTNTENIADGNRNRNRDEELPDVPF